jgi:hypothetical protein
MARHVYFACICALAVYFGNDVTSAESSKAEIDAWTLLDYLKPLPTRSTFGGSVLPLTSANTNTKSDAPGIHFNLICKETVDSVEVDPEMCDQTNAVLTRLKSRLEATIGFKGPVHVEAMFMGCHYLSKVCSETTLASAAPLEFVAVRIPNLGDRIPGQLSSESFVPNYEGVYLVPGTLAKQMKLTYEVPNQAPISFSHTLKADIIISINKNIKFWYGDEKEPYLKKYDLEQVLAHEVLV